MTGVQTCALPIFCHPLLLLPSVFSSIRVFSNEWVLHIRWPKYWSFSFSISPSNESSGLISFRIDSFDLLAVQGALKSLLQHHSSKVSVLQCSAFFMVQLSHAYMTTGKTIALIRWTFVGKVMSLLFNILSRFDWVLSFYQNPVTGQKLIFRNRTGINLLQTLTFLMFFSECGLTWVLWNILTFHKLSSVWVIAWTIWRPALL